MCIELAAELAAVNRGVVDHEAATIGPHPRSRPLDIGMNVPRSYEARISPCHGAHTYAIAWASHVQHILLYL